MKIKIKKSELLGALRKAEKPVSNRAVVPVLTGVLVATDEKGLTLMGSDSDLTVIANIPLDEENSLEIIKEGAIVLPAREFLNIVRSLDNGEVEITVDDLKANIIGGKANFTVHGVNASEYPRINTNLSGGFTVDSVLFNDLLNKTGYCTSTTETRPILTGVNLFSNSGNLGAVATDAHRLSRIYGVEVEGDLFEAGVTIPAGTVKELPALIGDSETVSVAHNKNQIVVKGDETVVVSRLLEGTYPDTDRLFPTDFQIEFVVSNDGLRSALERAIVLADENAIVRFDYKKEEGAMFETFDLSLENRELGTSSEKVIADEVTGLDEFKLSFSAKYLIDALKAMDSEKVRIKFSGEMQPFIVEPEEKDSELEIKKLILPVRTY